MDVQNFLSKTAYIIEESGHAVASIDLSETIIQGADFTTSEGFHVGRQVVVADDVVDLSGFGVTQTVNARVCRWSVDPSYASDALPRAVERNNNGVQVFLIP